MTDILEIDTIDVKSDDFEEVNETLYQEGLTDGQVVVPPTEERVERLLEGTDRDPNERVGIIPPRYGEATVEKIAVNAAMAGCKPEYMPVLITAAEAIVEDELNIYGLNATTHPVAPMLIINGPIVEELNLNYGYNVFGQGWRANSRIGRAVRLMLINIGGAVPGEMDRATQGQPAKFSFCIAENQNRNPWDPLHVARGYEEDESTVTVIGVGTPHEVNDHVSDTAAGVLTTSADVLATIGNNNTHHSHGEVGLVLGPEHANVIARDGWSREDIQWFLYDQARNDFSLLETQGFAEKYTWTNRFNLKDGNGKVPLLASPEDVIVTVAGGAGRHSTAFHTFGQTRSVTKKIE